jgi:hypothetical protein
MAITTGIRIKDPIKNPKNTCIPTESRCIRFHVLEFSSKKVQKKAVQPNPKPDPNEAIKTPHILNRRFLFIIQRKNERIINPKANIVNILTILITAFIKLFFSLTMSYKLFIQRSIIYGLNPKKTEKIFI